MNRTEKRPIEGLDDFADVLECDMAKPPKEIPPPPQRNTDRELMALVHKIADLLADRDPLVVSRVLDTLKTFYPSHVSVKPSTNGVGYMP